MNRTSPLALAGTGSLAASILHLACIAGGPDWYRAFGDGERTARMTARGGTLGFAAILSAWALHVWLGAGLIPRPPFLCLRVCAITGVYPLRALFFVPLQAYFPGNSTAY